MRETSALTNFITKDLTTKVNFRKFSFYTLKNIFSYSKKDQKTRDNSLKTQFCGNFSSNQIGILNKETNQKPSSLNSQNLHDAINLLNSHLISETSTIILNSKKIYIFCSKELLEISKDFSNNLLNIDIASSFYLSNHFSTTFNNCLPKDALCVFIDTSCDQNSLQNFVKDSQVIINIASNNCPLKDTSIFNLSVNLHNPQIKNVSEKNKIKIFLNCVYLNILSRKLKKQKQPD